MIGIGGATKYAIYRARGEKEEGSRIFFHALLLALLVSVLFIAIGVWFTEPICRWLGSNAATPCGHGDLSADAVLFCTFVPV